MSGPQIDADDDLVDLAIDVTEEQAFERKAKREAVERKLLAGATGVVSVPPAMVTIWAHATHQVDDVDADDVEREADIIETSGQFMPALGRRLADGTIEVIGRSYLVTAVLAYNNRHPEKPIDLKIDVRTFDEEAAFRLVAMELGETPRISAWDRGRFYHAAIEQFGSEAAVAQHLGVHKSTISRRLDVVRAVDMLGDRIVVKRDVRQRDASWFVQTVGREPDLTDAPDAEAADKVMAVAASLDPMPAKSLFAALRAAVKADRPQPDVTPLAHAGHAIGTIRRKSGGPIRIELTDVGDVELEALVDLLRDALARVRTAATL